MWGESILEIGKNWEFENQFTEGTTSTTTTPTKAGLKCPPNYTMICLNAVQCLCIQF